MPLDNKLELSTAKWPSNKHYQTDLKQTVRYPRLFLGLLGVWTMLSRNSSPAKKYIFALRTVVFLILLSFIIIPPMLYIILREKDARLRIIMFGPTCFHITNFIKYGFHITNFIKYGYVSKLLIVFCTMSMSFTLVPTALHMILREKSPIVKLILLGPVSSCFASVLKYVIIVLSCRTIKHCIEQMETDWMSVGNEDEREIMMRNAEVGRDLTVISSVFMYSGGLSYHMIMPLLKGTKINEFNETVRPLVYPGIDIFVEAQESPNYEIIFFVTCVSAFVRYTITITACNHAAVFVTHACGQIQIVIWRLENLFDGMDGSRNSDKLQQRISSVVHRHVNGLRLHSQIDESLREICLIEVVAVTLIICLLEYYCMTKWSNGETLAAITYSILLISYIFNIFILCHIGELLKEQSFEVGNCTYMIDWYRLPGKTGLAMVMLIAMSNYPRKISAGRMMELSLSSFGIIIKTSGVYLNMLHTMEV